MTEKTPEERQKELDEKMKKFLEKGKTVEKLPPGSAYNLGSLDFHGKPRYSALEIFLLLQVFLQRRVLVDK